MTASHKESLAGRRNADGLEHWQAGRPSEALTAFREAAAAARDEQIADHDVAAIDSNLATVAVASGDFEEGYAATLRVLVFQEGHADEEPEEQLDTLMALVDLGLRLERKPEALAHARNCWRVFSQSGRNTASAELQQRRPRVVARLGLALIAAGRDRRALPVLERACRDYAAQPAGADSAYYDTLEQLARLQLRRGDTGAAVLVGRALVALSRDLSGENDIRTGLALNLCGSLCYDDRKLEEAASCFQELLDRSVDAGFGPGERAGFGANLAKALLELDRLVEAATALDAAEQLLETHGLSKNPHAIGVLLARTQWLRRQRRFAEARQAVERSIAIIESHFGPTSPRLGTALTFLGGVLRDENRLDEAEAAYQRVVQLEALPELRRASALHNLGNLRLDRRDLAGARASTEASIAIKQRYGGAHGRLAPSLANLGAIERDSGNRPAARRLLEQALSLEEADYGFASPQSTLTLNNLAGVLAGEGLLDEALEKLSVVLATQRARLNDVLHLNDDARRIDLIGDMRHELDAYFGVASVILQESSDRAPLVYRELVRRKGLLTAALTMDQHRRRNATVAGVDDDVASIVDGTLSVLPAGTVLLDYILFGTAHLTLGPNPRTGLPNRQRYGVFVVRSADDVRFIDLGFASDIEPVVVVAMTAVRGEGNMAEARAATRQLRRLIWDPMGIEREHLDQVVIVPDGAINSVSFAALATEAPRGWIGDAVVFAYANAAREIFGLPSISPNHSGTALVICDPAYLLDGAPHWPRLSGTRLEGETVARHLDCPSVAFHDATTERLRAASRPRILHIAAHGFYWPRVPVPPPHLPERVRSMLADPDPLGRSGLVLSPQRNPGNDEEHDGILTSREVLELDLIGTELAVMSACETGLGHHEPLDGAHGLRRALRAAGVSTVVASLWKIDDATTPTLMDYFYRYLQVAPPFRALALAARDVAREPRTRHPSHWAAFISFGSLGRLLSSQPVMP